MKQPWLKQIADHLKSDRHSKSWHGWPFKIWTCPIFGSSMYWTIPVKWSPLQFRIQNSIRSVRSWILRNNFCVNFFNSYHKEATWTFTDVYYLVPSVARTGILLLNAKLKLVPDILLNAKFWGSGVPTRYSTSRRILKVCDLGQVEAK